MYVVVVHITVHSGAHEAFLLKLMENARTSLRKEPACRRFDVCVEEGNTDRFLLYEIYDDRAGFDAHLASAHYVEFDKSSRSMIAAKSVTCYVPAADGPGA